MLFTRAYACNQSRCLTAVWHVHNDKLIMWLITVEMESYLFLGTCLDRLQFLIFLPRRHLMFDYLRGWTKKTTLGFISSGETRPYTHLHQVLACGKKELGRLVPSFSMTRFFSTSVWLDSSVCCHTTAWGYRPISLGLRPRNSSAVWLLMRHTFYFTCTAGLALQVSVTCVGNMLPLTGHLF